MNLIAKHDISFEEALDLTAQFIDQISTLSEEEKMSIVSSLVMSENGARGFFVIFLTHDNSIVDQESTGIIQGLKTSPNIVSELLVKNVAMSTAMAITHQRNNDLQMSHKSQIVTNRSIKLIKELNMKEIQEKIKLLINTIKEGNGIYKNFIDKWGYDREQQDKIVEIFVNSLN